MQLLFLGFIVIPIVEMWLLIQVGSYFGALITITLVLLTALIGVSLLKKQGLSTFIKANQKMNAGQMPVAEMGEGVMLAVAGALLLTPGFVTDTFGFLLLIPALRTFIANAWFNKMMRKSSEGLFDQQTGFTYTSTQFREEPPPTDQINKAPAVDIIEGEYQEISDKDKKDT